MTVPEGVCIPIICFPEVFHGEKGGTREAYVPVLDSESLSGSPSSSTMWRRSECGRLMGRAGDDGEARVGCTPLDGGDDGPTTRSFVRVGACADELRLMGVTRVV